MQEDVMIDPQELFTKAEAAAADWADKDYAAGLLEDLVSSLEGVLASRYKSKGHAATLIPKLIKADVEWKEAQYRWREAKKEAMVARLKYEQINRFQDNIRTKESTERALAR
jgi:hypothetical protein